jgi:hypothetical protein
MKDHGPWTGDQVRTDRGEDKVTGAPLFQIGHPTSGIKPMQTSSRISGFAAAPSWAIGALLALALLGGCDRPLVLDSTLPAQMAENACINRCQSTKDRCDSDARFDYAQCQAGYQTAWRDYRVCKAELNERCGYPWWSCSENLYGYCSNRYWECRDSCRHTYR